MKALVTCLAVAGCASSAGTVPPVRFANAPIVRVVNDRRDVPRPPDRREFLPDLYFYEGSFERPVTRALELPRARRALGVNALDEVPDSTWFTNRIGVRELAPDEIYDGPTTHDPSRYRPWTVHSTKIGGTTLGLIITDTRGIKYLLKFDRTGDPPELETATHVIVNRLLWACGYNVTEDQILYIRPGDLVLADDAAIKAQDGHDVQRLTQAEVDQLLALVRHEPDGRIRTLASRWIDGKTLGGHPAEGVRDDDPNDRIRHELRRDLRGQQPIYAWLDAVDVTEGQFVDTWVADPADRSRHYVKHYAVDFGKSLGAMGAIDHDWWRGHAYRIDFGDMLVSLATLGVASRPWQEREAPPLRGVATLLDASKFDPGEWHPDTAGYTPFRTADRLDGFWGAKLIARFTRTQLRTAVSAGKLSDPRAVRYIVDTLAARARVTAAYWFARTNPLDRFTVSGSPDDVRLCFDDLAIDQELATGEATRYTITGFDFRARPVGAPITVAADGAHTCAPPLALAPAGDDDGYTMLRVTTERPKFAGSTWVHLAREPGSGRPRVIGVWRP
ncbi:MAG TPA: hypothetical protein VFK02_19030 [Kofleriaceae bacterium]|nr:hypothetical protein [Kofleriaceae bacterium]